MKATIQQMKAKAIDVLDKLGVNSLFRFIFEQEDKIFLFDTVDGIRTVHVIDTDSDLYRMAQEVERKTGCKVYAVLHSRMFFGETYDFLLVSNYRDDFAAMHTAIADKHLVYAYCHNVSDPKLSEPGSIVLRVYNGFLVRVN